MAYCLGIVYMYVQLYYSLIDHSINRNDYLWAKNDICGQSKFQKLYLLFYMVQAEIQCVHWNKCAMSTVQEFYVYFF